MKLQNSTIYLLSFAKKFKAYWFMLTASAIFGSLISVLLPYLAKIEMDQLANKKDNVFFLNGDPFKLFLIIIGVILLSNVMMRLQGIITSGIKEYYGRKLEVGFKLDLYDRLNNIKTGFFLNKRNSYFFRELRDTGDITNQAISMFLDVLRIVVEATGITIVFTFIDYRIGLTLFIIMLISFYIESKRRVVEEKYGIRNKYELEKYIYRAENQLIDNRHQLQISGGVQFMEGFLNDYFKKIFEANKGRIGSDFIYGMFSLFSSEVLTTVIKIIVGYSIFQHSGSIGLMSMTIMYVGNMRSLIWSGMSLYINTFLNFKTNFQKFKTLYVMSEMPADKLVLDGQINSIEVKDVRFTYPKISKEELKLYEILNEKLIKLGDNKYEWGQRNLHFIQDALEDAKVQNPEILKSINAKFEKGKIYGIVGKNGAGKTTLVNLLMGYFDEFSGNICYNNQDIKELNNDVFGENISYVSQSPYIMEFFTIKQNLLLGVKREVPDSELNALLKKFGLLDRLNSFRRGLDSEIGFDADLSGGQRQLLTLIRAILQDRKIIVFDEGTNQLDAENELLIMQELLKNKKDKIIIFITHRMTTIKKSDYIYCVDDGKIVDGGKHDELLKRESIYKKFWETQVDSKFE